MSATSKNPYGTARPVLYLDLDGTVRHGKDELGHFVNKVEDVVVFDGVPDLLRRYKRAGWRIVAISNQGGIALGLVTPDEMRAIMLRTHELSGQAFDKMAWCSHHPNAKDPEMARCWCRKPRIGMILASCLSLSVRFGEYYPPHLGLFVGDRPEDRECAEAANLDFMDAAEWRTGKHAEAL